MVAKCMFSDLLKARHPLGQSAALIIPLARCLLSAAFHLFLLLVEGFKSIQVIKCLSDFIRRDAACAHRLCECLIALYLLVESACLFPLIGEATRAVPIHPHPPQDTRVTKGDSRNRHMRQIGARMKGEI